MEHDDDMAWTIFYPDIWLETRHQIVISALRKLTLMDTRFRSDEYHIHGVRFPWPISPAKMDDSMYLMHNNPQKDRKAHSYKKK